jgi:hypothetical protein
MTALRTPDNRWSRRLLRLYPLAWQARYGDEFTAFADPAGGAAALAAPVLVAVASRAGAPAGSQRLLTS